VRLKSSASQKGLPELSPTGPVAAFIQAMEGLGEIPAVLDAEGVAEPGPQRLGGEQGQLLEGLMLQNPHRPRLHGVPALDGGPVDEQLLAVQDDGAGLPGDRHLDGDRPGEVEGGEVRVDEEVVAQRDDVRGQPHRAPRELRVATANRPGHAQQPQQHGHRRYETWGRPGPGLRCHLPCKSERETQSESESVRWAGVLSPEQACLAGVRHANTDTGQRNCLYCTFGRVWGRGDNRTEPAPGVAEPRGPQLPRKQGNR